MERERKGTARPEREDRASSARDLADEVKALAANGMGTTEIASRLGIDSASVYRILQATDCMGR